MESSEDYEPIEMKPLNPPDLETEGEEGGEEDEGSAGTGPHTAESEQEGGGAGDGVRCWI